MIKLRRLIIALGLLFTAMLAVTVLVLNQTPVQPAKLDMTSVNDLAQTLLKEPQKPPSCKEYGLDYTLFALDGDLVCTSRDGLAQSLSDAAENRDTIIDIPLTGQAKAKLAVHNDAAQMFTQSVLNLCIFLALFLLFAMGICCWYAVEINRKVFRPFQKLRHFAKNVAAGKLDVPLEMDKGNHFGAFTESFDLMRTELARAKENERRAALSKKELVANLSHDLKTPVASIKAVSELMLVKEHSVKARENLLVINDKADQIDLLVSNLFHATLEELEQLTVKPTELLSTQVSDMLSGADFHRRIVAGWGIPQCMVLADPLRLREVFDNIISNSYKYAGTPITVESCLSGDFLVIKISDSGGGAEEGELALLSQKFRRGKNASNKTGAGLGLYLSQHFMQRMNGRISFENLYTGTQRCGFSVRLEIPFAGREI